MNQALKDLWKKNFPLWPDVLIEKFSDQIEIESNYFDEQFGAAQKKFYDEQILSVNRNLEFMFNGQRDIYQGINFFSPSNPKYLRSQQWETGNIYVPAAPENVFFSDPVVASGNTGFHTLPELQNGWRIDLPFRVTVTNVHVSVNWDSRLFGDLNLSFQARFDRSSADITISYFWIMQVTPVIIYFLINALNVAKPYRQSDSLIALHENGKDMQGVDYAKLYEFSNYVKAYQNYGAQIQGAADVAKKTVAADLQNYRSDLDSKLLAQKNNLQNLTLQLTSQTAAEAASAKRDMQQLSLQVAAIKLQIMGLVK